MGGGGGREAIAKNCVELQSGEERRKMSKSGEECRVERAQAVRSSKNLCEIRF